MSTSSRLSPPRANTRHHGADTKPAPSTSGGPHDARASEGTSPTKATKAPKGLFWVLASDARCVVLAPLKDETHPPPPQNPDDELARRIAFHLRRDVAGEVPRDQLEFCAGAERILHVIRHLYPFGDPAKEPRFRERYVSIFKLAHLVLEDRKLSVDAGKAELASIERDLIHDEGPGVKNAQIWELVRVASYLAIPIVLGYGALSYVLAQEPGAAYGFLLGLHVEPAALANFLLLWLGVLLGVCLSYALRKPNFTVDDLVAATGPDLLRPLARLLFAGTIATLLAMLATSEIVDAQIGSLQLSKVAERDGYAAAFLAGVVCGISELLLPSMLLSRMPTPKTA